MAKPVNIGHYGKLVDLGWVPPRLCWRLWFKGPDGKLFPESLKHGVETYRGLADLAVKHAIWQLRFKPSIPPIYSGVVKWKYQDGAEDWQDPSVMAETGLGDCDNAVVQRVAELILDGIDAAPDVQTLHNPVSFHLRVRRATIDRNLPPVLVVTRGNVEEHVITRAKDGNGWIEDTSLALGM